MSPKIHAEFWTDPGLDDIAPEFRLVLLWMITNPMTDITGTFEINNRRFKFETNLHPDWIDKTLAAFPRMFVREGHRVWLRTFVRHQFGQGVKLTRNKMGLAVAKAVWDLPGRIKAAVWLEYPELKNLGCNGKPIEGDGKPIEGDGKPIEGDKLGLSLSGSDAHPIPIPSPSHVVRTEQSKNRVRTESGEGTGEGCLRTATGEERGRSDAPGELAGFSPGSPPEGLRYDLAAGLVEFLNKKTGANFQPVRAVLEEVALRLVEVGGDVAGMRAMVERQVAQWRGTRMEQYLRPLTLFECQKFHGYYGQRNTPVLVDAAQVAGRMKELRDRIDTCPANRESAWHSAAASDAEKADLKKWRRELAELRAMHP